jgi:hypothetical protein
MNASMDIQSVMSWAMDDSSPNSQSPHTLAILASTVSLTEKMEGKEGEEVRGQTP